MRFSRNCPKLKTLNVSNSGISWDSLACAVNQVKTRKNNVVLTMLVSHRVFDEFRNLFEDVVPSLRLYVLPFLRIEVSDRVEDEEDSDESQESDYYEYDVSDEEDNNFDFFAMPLGRLFHHNQHNETGWHVVENRSRNNGSANVNNNNIQHINKDGNLVDGNGRRVDNQGHILDGDGNRIDGHADFIGHDEW